MNELVLSKSSSESDLKRYFTAVLELSKSDNKFPINLDEVWPLVYSGRNKATRALKENFFENEDFITVTQNGQGGQFAKTDYFLSLSCLEYFIARKVRPVFEVYRQVFHKTVSAPSLPMTYKEALTQLLASVEQNEKLQMENEKLQGDVRAQQTINSVLSAEVEELQPKGRIYDKVMNSQENSLSTTSSVANEIGMSGQKLNKMLIACGVIYKAPNGEYLFTSDYRGWNLGRSVSVTIGEETCRIKTYIKWNTRGRAYIHALKDTNWDKRRAWHLLKEGKERVCIND
jgi:phage antirepressor YoqD-like protein